MNPDKRAEILEAHLIVTEMIGEYKAVMDGGRKLLSSLDSSKSREELISRYLRMSKLAHYVNVQIARSCKTMYEG